MLDCCRPLAVEVYELTDRSVLKEWKSPVPPPYRGMHGILLPKPQP
jgi:hypothetical protein